MPSILGGTMLVTASGELAIAGDSEQAALWIVDLETHTLHGRIDLAEGEEIGRLVEDGAGRVHVVLRRTGAVLDVDPQARTILGTRQVCAAPRGIDWDAATDQLHVACASGELVTLPAAGGAPTRIVSVEPDLRDVVVSGDRLYVSVFRSAELLTIDASGTVIARRRPTSTELLGELGPVTFTPNVAYRIRAMEDGRVFMLHQRSISTPIDVERQGYGSFGECFTGVVAPAVTLFPAEGPPPASGVIQGASLMVDGAVAGGLLYLASARTVGESGRMPFPPAPSMTMIPTSSLSEPCPLPGSGVDHSPAIAFDVLPDGRAVVLHRSPSEITVEHPSTGLGSTLALETAGSPRGHQIFHTTTPVLVACASCHPEGGEDGHVWDFQPTGPRRTQSLLGGIEATRPFHWDGDQANMHAIMSVTFGQRMLGAFDANDVTAVSAWVDGLEAPRGVVADASAVERGRALFESAECASCHAGATLTNNTNADVGTGGRFQVPSLRGVLYRGPYLHDGRAATLEAVLASAGDTHGRTAALDADQRADLLAYLRSR
jgi:mono/diheme cytochrome c family protein